MQQSVMEGSSSSQGSEATTSTSVKSYDDLFPALPKSNNTNHYNCLDTVNNNMRVGSSKISQVFRLPFEERKLDGSHKFGEGESLQTCSMIMQDTDTQIEITSHAKDQSLTFSVFGRPMNVAEAHRRILIHFRAQASKQLLIPKEYHRCVLGKKGGRLKDIEKETGTKISVPPVNDTSEMITITGTKEGVEKADHAIRVTVDKQSKKASESLNVPKIYHPFIVGPYNEYVNNLMEETGTRIIVPSHLVPKDEILIAGEKDGVAAAIAKIEAIHQEMKKKCTTVSVEVPKSQHKYVIGPKGATIADILQTTGISVEVPPSDTASDTITLRGPHDKLGEALTKVCERANAVQQQVVMVEPWLHRHIIGPKRQTINEITMHSSDTRVEFNDKDGKIKIEGPPEEVSKVKVEIENLAYALSQQMRLLEWHVDQKLFKYIIGKSGANVNRMKDEYGVHISIEDSGVIRIEGPKEGVDSAHIEMQNTIHKVENTSNVEMAIEQRYHRQIIGAKGENIREMRDRFKIQINVGGDGTDVVRLRGATDDVEQCRRHLEELVNQFRSSYVLDVPIYKQYHKYVIGKGGANIKRIREETNTEIEVPDEGSNRDSITVTGKRDNVEQARDKILKILSEVEVVTEEIITIPPQFYNSLIGAKGKLIHAIMQECGGVTIRFPSADSNSDQVVIRGPKDDVDKAKHQLLKLAKERELASFTAEIRAQPQHHKFLIGRGGANVKRIRDETGTRIVFPSNHDDDDPEVITIIGTEESVHKAKSALQQAINEIHNIVEDEMCVEPKHHRHFVQKRGELLHRLADEYGGVMISFPRSGEDSTRVVLKGPKESIEAVKVAIGEIVADLESHITIECVIPQKHHRAVMGHRGVKIQNITNTCNVQIKFPERNRSSDGGHQTDGCIVNGDANVNDDGGIPSRSDVIRICGKEEDCVRAKEALLDLIPVTVSVEVPYDLHRSIIGRDGRDVKELMDCYDVHIMLSPMDIKDDCVKITGSASKVENAKNALLKRVAEMQVDRELRAFTVQLEVKPEYHPKIIGRSGAVITKIRTEHDVQITFPRKNDPDNENIITIRGYEENVKVARDVIMKIVNDLDDLVKESIEIDSRIHSRLIGTRGRSIRKVMDECHVEIKFPPASDTDCNAVIISGSKKNVAEAKEHLMNLADGYMQDIEDREEYKVPHYRSESTQMRTSEHNGNRTFMVSGGPWEQKAPNTASETEFPTFGQQNSDETAGPPTTSPVSGAWGNRR